MSKTIDVLYFKDAKSEPEIIEIQNDLKTMQTIVGGYIEVTRPFGTEQLLICNEEGNLLGLEPNRIVGAWHRGCHDVIVGPFFVATGTPDGDICSIRESEARFVKTMLLEVNV